MLLGSSSHETRFALRPASGEEALASLRSSRGLFLRTPLLLPLGAPMHLALDIGRDAPVDVHVFVAARSAHPRQAGIFVRPLPDDDGVAELAAWLGDTPVEHALAVEARFDHDDDAARELAAFRERGEGIFPVRDHVGRGQVVALGIMGPRGALATIEGVVHHPVLVDGVHQLVVRRLPSPSERH